MDPLWASGSKRKRAAISGAAYYVEAIVPFAVEQDGRMRLTCAKDRHGSYRRGEHVADLVLDAQGRFRLYEPPDITEAELPIELAAKAAVKALDIEGRRVSQRALSDLMAIKCRNETKRGGIDLAVARGWIIETKDGQARRFDLPPDPPT